MRILGSVLGFSLLVVALPDVAATQTWRELGPSPIGSNGFTGRLSGIAPSQQRAGLLYAAAASGGVWRSTNAGSNWTPVGQDLPTLALGAIAVDPTDDKVVYAGSGEANGAYHSLYGLGLYKSTDRGASWKVLGVDVFAGRTISRIEVSPHDPNDVWVATDRAGGTAGTLEGARLHPKRGEPVGIYRSRNGGETWDRVRGGLPPVGASDVRIDPVDPGRVWVALGERFGRNPNGVYRSLDGGRSFQKLDADLGGVETGRISIGIAPSDPDRIYFLPSHRSDRTKPYGFSPGGAVNLSVVRTDDGGESFQPPSYPGDFMGQQGNYNSAIAVDPDDPDTFFLGGVRMLRSTDGGTSYTDVTPPHVDIHSLTFDTRGFLQVGSDGGFFLSPDGGDTWLTRNRGLGAIQAYAGTSLGPGALVLAGIQDNGTNLRVGDGRSAWVHVLGGDGGYTAVHPEDPSILFAQFQGADNLFRSSDGGLTFSESSTGIGAEDRHCFLPPFAFDPTDPDRLLYATHRIYESTDGGRTWRAISSDLTRGEPFSVRSLAIAPSNPALVHAMTNGGRLLTSRDAGSTWTVGLENLGGWPRVTRQIAIDPATHAVAYLADMRFGGGRVWRTADAGRTWTRIGNGLPNRPVAAVAVHRVGRQRIVFAGTDQGVYLSRNEGATWERWADGMPGAPVQDLIVDAQRDRIVATTLGRGVWWAPLPTTGTSQVRR